MNSTQGMDRAARRTRRRRNRTLVATGTVSVAVLAILGFLALSGGSTEKAAPKADPTTSESTTTAATTTIAPLSKDATIATTVGGPINIFENPGDTTPKTTLGPKTDYGVARTLLVLKQNPDGWLQVSLPIRPNGSTGWIKPAEVTLSTTPYDIKINLDDRKLVMKKGNEVIVETKVAIGAEKTPTPPGEYYITDPVDLRTNPNSAYGVFALGISGHSDVLFEFAGGPGQLAVHGTNQPELIGQRVSNGCIRVPNDVILKIAEVAPLGTPVHIV